MALAPSAIPGVWAAGGGGPQQPATSCRPPPQDGPQDGPQERARSRFLLLQVQTGRPIACCCSSCGFLLLVRSQ